MVQSAPSTGFHDWLQATTTTTTVPMAGPTVAITTSLYAVHDICIAKDASARALIDRACRI
jgi:hypothetical protein